MQEPDYTRIWKQVKDTRLDEAVDKALIDFWARIAAEFPEVKTGDYPPDLAFAFETECKRAVGWWLFLNHPEIS